MYIDHETYSSGWLTINNNYFFKHNLIILPLTFRSLPEIFVRRSLFTSSSSGSCHGSDVTWQENGRTYGSVCSSPRHGWQIVVPPYGCGVPLWSIWCLCRILCILMFTDHMISKDLSVFAVCRTLLMSRWSYEISTEHSRHMTSSRRLAAVARKHCTELVRWISLLSAPVCLHLLWNICVYCWHIIIRLAVNTGICHLKTCLLT